MRAAQMRLLHWKLGLKMRCKCSLGLFVQSWNCLKYLLVVSLPTPFAAYSQAFSMNAFRWRIRHKQRGVLQTLSDHAPDPKQKGRAECGGLGTRQVESVTNRWFRLLVASNSERGGRETYSSYWNSYNSYFMSFLCLSRQHPLGQVTVHSSGKNNLAFETEKTWRRSQVVCDVRALLWKRKTIKAQIVDSK